MLPRLAVIIIIVQNAFAGCHGVHGVIWSKRRQEFVTLFSVPEFSKLQKEFLSRIRQMETHTFAREVIKVSYYEERNIAVFVKNNTRVTGLCGEIWNLLADYLNFTLVPVRSEQRSFGTLQPNGSYNGLIGMLQRDEAQIILRTGYYQFLTDSLDFLTPMWKTRYNLYIRPEWKYDNTWMCTLFSRTTWCAIGVLFIVLSVAGYVAQKISDESKSAPIDASSNYNLNDHIFHTFAMMCAQGYVPSDFYNRFKILSLSKSVFAWLVLLAFSSHLIYQMANRTLTPPFEDLHGLFNRTNYVLLTFKGSMIRERLEERIKPTLTMKQKVGQRFQLVSFTDKAYNEVCHSKRQYALLTVEDKHMASSRTVCPLITVGPGHYETWVASAIQKDFYYKRTIDIAIIRLLEVGLVDVNRNRWLSTRLDNKLERPFKTIDIDQVYLSFLMLCIGTGISLVVLAVENVLFVCGVNVQ